MYFYTLTNALPPTLIFLFCLFSVQETKKQKYKKNNARPTERPSRNEDTTNLKNNQRHKHHAVRQPVEEQMLQRYFPTLPPLSLSFFFSVLCFLSQRKATAQQTADNRKTDQKSRKQEMARFQKYSENISSCRRHVQKIAMKKIRCRPS